jgi:hypothetical protein
MDVVSAVVQVHNAIIWNTQQEDRQRCRVMESTDVSQAVKIPKKLLVFYELYALNCIEYIYKRITNWLDIFSA